jgi:hypothetical protein
MEPNSCIYCKNSFDSVAPSKSDIIPDFLGDGLILENAVCKTCNNQINSDVEMPLRDHFQFLRLGLDLPGRRRKSPGLSVDVEIESLSIKIRGNYDKIKDRGIPPLKLTGEDGKKYYVVIGTSSYIEEIKGKLALKKPNIIWQEANEKGYVKLTGSALPTKVMSGELAKRLAAKIAFERFCQKKSSLVALDRIYDDIRNYVRSGTSSKVLSTLIYNQEIMLTNMNFPFPYHCIVLTNDLKRDRIVGVVSLFGLYYYLVLIAKYLLIQSPWDNCVTVDPQESYEYELVIRGAQSVNIPDDAWIVNKLNSDQLLSLLLRNLNLLWSPKPLSLVRKPSNC